MFIEALKKVQNGWCRFTVAAAMLLIIPPVVAQETSNAENSDVGASNAQQAKRRDPRLNKVTHVVVHSDQFYGRDREDSPQTSGRGRCICDVYLPGQPPPALGYPTVIVIHGGGWAGGDKWTLESYSRKLALAGIAAVTINYRLAPKHKFPAQVDDVRQAMIWVSDQAKKYSFDLDRLGMCGYSAGGHLTLLISSLADETMEDQITASYWSGDDGRWKKLPSLVAVCAGGPYCNFESLPIDNTTMSYFLGGSRRDLGHLYRAASPLAFVSPADPTTFIIHGDADLLVPITGAREFFKKQQASGVEVSMKEMPNQGHMTTFLNPQTSELFVDFFRSKLMVH